MINLYVIILTYNNEKTIDKLLNSLSPLKSKLKVMVVDNNSKDYTLSIVGKYGWVSVLKNKNNLGFSAGNNKGIKYALSKKADVIFILNPDTILRKDFISNMSKSLKEFNMENELGLMGPKIYDESEKIWSLGGKLDKKRYSSILIKKISKNLDYISGTAIFIKKEVFNQIGFFKEDYFLYYEDLDFCQRAKNAGYAMEIDSRISITHKESSTVGKNSPIMQYYLARNHLLFLSRFAPLRIKIREAIRLPKTLMEAKKRKYELLGIFDFLIRRFGKSAYWN